MTIHQLVTRHEEISREVVSILEDYLEMAKQGEITSVAIAAVLSDGAVMHQASTTDQQPILLGAVTRLLHRMNLNADDETE